MRGIDWAEGYFTAKYWFTGDDSGLELCPLLKVRAGFMNHVDAIQLKPGYNIPVCPMCGEEHRWPLLRLLLQYTSHFDCELPVGLREYILEQYGGYRANQSPPEFPDPSILRQVSIRRPKLPPEPRNMSPLQKQEWDELIAGIKEKFYLALKNCQVEDDLQTIFAKRRRR